MERLLSIATEKLITSVFHWQNFTMVKLFSTISRWKSVKIFASFCLLVLFGIISEYKYIHQDVCSNDISYRKISTLCSRYYNKEIGGSMCPKLCDQQVLYLRECHGHLGSKTLGVLSCDGCIEPGKTTAIVMKEGHFLADLRKLAISTLNSTDKKVVVAKKYIYDAIKNTFGHELVTQSDPISFILGWNYEEQIKKYNSTKALDSILSLAMSLATQEEYPFLRVFGSNPFLPKLYGTCGESYFVEYTPAFPRFNYVILQAKLPYVLQMSFQFPTWKERAGIALKLLDLIVLAEDTYEKPLQICDIKQDNFGVNARGEVTLLDTDSVRFDNIIPYKPCKIDRYCSLNSCLGVCNQTTHMCSPEMVTNNLQVMCDKIFVSKVEMLGLLRNPPSSIRKPLQNLLHECKYPRDKIFKMASVNKSDRKLLKELTELLKGSLMES